MCACGQNANGGNNLIMTLNVCLDTTTNMRMYKIYCLFPALLRKLLSSQCDFIVYMGNLQVSHGVANQEGRPSDKISTSSSQ